MESFCTVSGGISPRSSPRLFGKALERLIEELQFFLFGSRAYDLEQRQQL
jgi:hypothetical protein